MYRATNERYKTNCKLLYEHTDGLPFFIFDTETTGVKENDRIVELAILKCQIINKKAVILEEHDIYIQPPFEMEQKVIDIHGITNEFLKGKPTEKEVFQTIKKVFGRRPILVGHNVEFDIGMVSRMYERNGETFTFQIGLDTLDMARDVLFGKDVTDYKLGTLLNITGLDFGLTFHNALDDIKGTLRLLDYCYAEYKDMPDENENKTILYMNYMYYWKGYNKKQSGMYVDTNLGRIYYSTFYKCWLSSKVDLEKCNINALETEVLLKTGLPSMKEYGRMTENKFKALKAERRKQNVYL